MSNTKKIERVSAVISKLCNLYIILIPLLLIWIWIDLDRIYGSLENLNDAILPEELALPNRVLGFIFSMIPVALMIWGLSYLKALLKLFQRGIFFSKRNAQLLKNFAKMLFLSTLAIPISGALVSVAVTINNPPGQRSVIFNLGTDELGSFFAAAIFLVLAWVIREASVMSKDSDQLT
tara:strand:- start:170 stop:703 length:534 start_codon:yes stop_codon:yes gene_type:complete